jgi:hypothetical protein
MTTGRSATGAHLRVETEDDQVVDLHLGPLSAVEHVLEQVPIGQSIRSEAFRTERMPEDAYVAKSLILDDKIIHLRDDNLCPSWAAGTGAGRGGGPRRGGGPSPGGCWWDN